MYGSIITTILLLAQVASAATSLIYPAYLYPTTGAWDPLFTALAANPTLTFQIIINPNSGPGGGQPDASYATAVTKLKSYANAVVIGYVPTSYGSRSSSLIQGDISLYSNWTTAARPHGIFFDEVASSSYSSLASNTAFVKSLFTGTTGAKGGLVVYNPGTIPADSALYTAPDQVVVFESPYSSLAGQTAALKAISGPAKSKLSAIVTSYGNSTQEQATINSALFSGWGSVYLTQDPATYKSFYPDFPSFAKLLATGIPTTASTSSSVASSTSTKASSSVATSTSAISSTKATSLVASVSTTRAVSSPASSISSASASTSRASSTAASTSKASTSVVAVSSSPARSSSTVPTSTVRLSTTISVTTAASASTKGCSTTTLTRFVTVTVPAPTTTARMSTSIRASSSSSATTR